MSQYLNYWILSSATIGGRTCNSVLQKAWKLTVIVTCRKVLTKWSDASNEQSGKACYKAVHGVVWGRWIEWTWDIASTTLLSRCNSDRRGCTALEREWRSERGTQSQKIHSNFRPLLNGWTCKWPGHSLVLELSLQTGPNSRLSKIAEVLATLRSSAALDAWKFCNQHS